MRFTGSTLAGMTLIALSSGPAAAEDVTLSFAHIWTLEHPLQTCGIDGMSEALDAAGVGLTIRSYPSEQLGTMGQMTETLMAGDVDMSIVGASYLASRYETMNIFDSPYIFKSAEEAYSLAGGDQGKKILQGLLDTTGIRTLGHWYYGARHITSNKPIKSPDDLNGVKYRVPDSRLMIDAAKAIGATPVPMTFGEIYLALQQGVIDAQENPLTSIDDQKFAEVQDYVSLTSHMIMMNPVVISEKSWEKLNDAQKAALADAVRDVTPVVDRCMRDQEEAILEKWKEDGSIEIVPAEDIDLQAFRDRAHQYIADTYGDTEWGKIYAEFVSD